MKVKVLMCRVGEPAKVEEVDATLSSLQALVGGDLQEVPLPNNLYLYCNETRHRLPFNRNIPARAQPAPPGAFIIKTDLRLADPGEMGVFQMHGNFFVGRVKDGALVDVEGEDVKAYAEFLGLDPKCPTCGNKVAYQGAVYCGAACAAKSGA